MIINLFGGPGIGKSTIAAGLFSTMNKKYKGDKSVELVTEYAKDLTWDNRQNTLSNQLYIAAKQYSRLLRVTKAEVDYIVNDGPMLQGNVYARKFCKYPEAYYETIKYFNDDLGPRLNILFRRSTKYKAIGRPDEETLAIQLDKEIEDMLVSVGEPFYKLSIGNVEGTIINIIEGTNND